MSQHVYINVNMFIYTLTRLTDVLLFFIHQSQVKGAQQEVGSISSPRSEEVPPTTQPSL